MRSISCSPVIQIQNTLDTYHYACDFIPIWEALGGLLSEDQPPAVNMTRACRVTLLDMCWNRNSDFLINEDSFTAPSVMPPIRISKV